MRLADIIGHGHDVAALLNMAKSGRVAHAMLLYENDGCGALPLALAYVQALNCKHPLPNGDACGECVSCRQMSKLIHPDLKFVFPTNEGGAFDTEWRELCLKNPYFTEADLQNALGLKTKSGIISIAHAKAIVENLSMASVSDGYKAVVMYLPEKMNAPAANKLLKAIEEPPAKTIFILITHNPERVLQTIFSRCQSMRLAPYSKEEVAEILERHLGYDAALAEEKAGICGGSVGTAVQLLSDSRDYDSMMDLFGSLMERLLARDLYAALSWVDDAVEALGSREKQKAFCIFAGECIRKIFMLQRKLPQIAAVPAREADFYSRMAAGCSSAFCSKTIKNLDKVAEMIDRNVSLKILYCDLVNRMYLSI